MFRKLICIAVIMLHISCGSDKENETFVVAKDTVAIRSNYSKNDLSKISWIEGKWRGMYDGKPFYEIYEIVNGNLKITGYDWNGDSSNTSVDYVTWKNDAYYLGKEQNYKVTILTDSVIKMVPVKANNNITWRKMEKGWDAILTGKKGITVYNMERFDPFKK